VRSLPFNQLRVNGSYVPEAEAGLGKLNVSYWES
jgi:hypothetical protein